MIRKVRARCSAGSCAQFDALLRATHTHKLLTLTRTAHAADAMSSVTLLRSIVHRSVIIEPLASLMLEQNHVAGSMFRNNRGAHSLGL